jgi:hypothetical protein
MNAGLGAGLLGVLGYKTCDLCGRSIITEPISSRPLRRLRLMSIKFSHARIYRRGSKNSQCREKRAMGDAVRGAVVWATEESFS